VRLYRLRAAGLAVVFSGLGWVAKFGGGPEWLADAAAGAIYVAFWACVVAAIFPRHEPRNTCVGVTVVTCLLELLQLWHPVWLDVLRAPFVGRVLLGHVFSWGDFPFYFLGGAAAYAVLRR